MLPNKTQKEGRQEALVGCQCNGFHYLHVSQWSDGELMMEFIDRPTTLWAAIGQWWKHREYNIAEVVLTKEDAAAIVNILSPK